MALGTVALALIAIFIPPLPVILKRGCGGHFLLNLLLLLLCWFPAVFHAWWIIAEDRDRSRRRPRSSSRGSSRTRRSYEKDGQYRAPSHYAGPPPAQQRYYHQHHQPPSHAYGPSYGRGQGKY